MKRIIKIYTYLALIFCFLVLLIPGKMRMFFFGMEIGIAIADIITIKIGGNK